MKTLNKRKISAGALQIVELLKSSKVFPGIIKTEVCIKRINPEATHNLYVDIYVDAVCAIEIDGEQHSRPVAFGGITNYEAQQRLIRQKQLDNIKADYLARVSIPLIRIPRSEIKNITPEILREKLAKAQDEI